MLTLKGTRYAYFDIDNTLIGGHKEFPKGLKISIKIKNRSMVCWVNFRMVEMVKEMWGRGFVVVAWSQGGAEWASAVIKALKLTPCVDLAIGKPDFFFDDKPASAFLSEDRRTLP
jgi:hypothetical protein